MTPLINARAAKAPTARRNRATGLLYQSFGVALALLLWQLLTSSRAISPEFGSAFAPLNAFRALGRFVVDGSFVRHAAPSLARFGIGLLIALAVGIPVGIVVGYSRRMHQITNTVFQFIRMTSPLAWMPLAIILFGVGNKPIYVLIAVAAVWPIVINTAHGVRSVNPVWIKVVRMLGGGKADVLRRAIIPAILPDILTGLRISVGVSWIVLVPAEMLGVSSGLGYYILDTRDRFDYAELMAVILVVGFLGFVSDGLIQLAQRGFAWRMKEQETEGW
jgi:NitT/TauT family transport system permease protein